MRSAVLLATWAWLLLAPVWAFDIPLERSSHFPTLGLAPYAIVHGQVDAEDSMLFHLVVTLGENLQGDLNGGDRFGIVAFWFNTQLPIDAELVFPVPMSSSWRMQINNPSCPQNCRETGVRWGEFNHQIIWQGPASERPFQIRLDFYGQAPWIEDDFLKASAVKPAGANTGMFAIYIDGFDLVIDGEHIRGTFVKDE